MFAEIYEVSLHKSKDLAYKLLTRKLFYVIVERFYNSYCIDNPYLSTVFYKYFWDGSYVDIWALPLVLLDIFRLNTKTLNFYKRKDKNFFKDMKITVLCLEYYVVEFFKENEEFFRQTKEVIENYRYLLKLLVEKIEFIESN